MALELVKSVERVVGRRGRGRGRQRRRGVMHLVFRALPRVSTMLSAGRARDVRVDRRLEVGDECEVGGELESAVGAGVG